MGKAFVRIKGGPGMTTSTDSGYEDELRRRMRKRRKKLKKIKRK